jgi:hypothetical protein
MRGWINRYRDHGSLPLVSHIAKCRKTGWSLFQSSHLKHGFYCHISPGRQDLVDQYTDTGVYASLPTQDTDHYYFPHRVSWFVTNCNKVGSPCNTLAFYKKKKWKIARRYSLRNISAKIFHIHTYYVILTLKFNIGRKRLCLCTVAGRPNGKERQVMQCMSHAPPSPLPCPSPPTIPPLCDIIIFIHHATLPVTLWTGRMSNILTFLF